MQMPTTYRDDLFAADNRTYPDGSPIVTRVYSMVYPPIGFFPFAGIGNGDYHGLYWPIGREDADPLVAFSSHNAYALIPQHGDLRSACVCQIAQNDEGIVEDGFEAVRETLAEPLSVLESNGVISADDHRSLLRLDPLSPYRNCAVADLDVLAGNLDVAEIQYRKAIELLPEYGAAHFGLGYLLRRVRREADAAAHLRMSLICPRAFSGSSFWAEHALPGTFRNDWPRKALLWLQQSSQRHELFNSDPFLKEVKEIRLSTGDANDCDVELMTKMVEAYSESQQHVDAIYLWIVIGDLAASQTTSFRERHKLTGYSYARRLCQLLRLAGIDRRAALAEDMLGRMEKPNGLYL